MKYYNLLLAIIILFFSMSTPIYAQYTEKEIKRHKKIIAKSERKASIEVSLDTIYHVGMPYGVVKKQEAILGVAEGYTIAALNGQEVISIDVPSSDELSDYILYRPLTKASGIAYIQHLPTVKSMAKRIVRYNLLTSEGINPTSFLKFQEKYPHPKFLSIEQEVAKKNMDIVVKEKPIRIKRNRSAMIFTIKGNITQDQMRIASYTDETEQRNGRTFRVYYIYYVNHQLCGKLWIEVGDRTSMMLMTQIDKKIYTLEQTGYKQPLDIAILHLINKLYL